jgi:hypothetical protein
MTYLTLNDLNNMPVLNNDMDQAYLNTINQVILKALNAYPRLFVFRFDLHLPRVSNNIDCPLQSDGKEITRFIDSFKAKISHDIAYRERTSVRVHNTYVRYVWVREFGEDGQEHYHVVIFLNRDCYWTLGNYQQQTPSLSTKVVEAWGSALRVDWNKAQSLVHFPQDTPVYHINLNDSSYIDTVASLVRRLSYFAKLDSKQDGDHRKSIGCSRN